MTCIADLASMVFALGMLQVLTPPALFLRSGHEDIATWLMEMPLRRVFLLQAMTRTGYPMVAIGLAMWAAPC